MVKRRKVHDLIIQRTIGSSYEQFVIAMKGYKASIKVLEEGIVKAQETFEEELFNYITHQQEMTEEERAKWRANHRIEAVYDHAIPDITWQAMVMSVFGAFEYHLAVLCRNIALVLAESVKVILKPEFHFPIQKIFKLKASYIRHSKKFIQDLFPDTREVFKEYKSFLGNLSFFRNCIAHNGGFIPHLEPKYDKKVKKCKAFCKSNTGIDISVYGQIQVRPEFLGYSIDTLQGIFHDTHLIVNDQAQFVSEDVEPEGK